MSKPHADTTKPMRGEELFELIKPLLEAYVTDRIVIFHNALIERDQISPPSAASRFAYGEERPKPNLTVVTPHHTEE